MLMPWFREQAWNAGIADQVQRADDNQVVVRIVKEFADLRRPATIACRDQYLVQLFVAGETVEQS